MLRLLRSRHVVALCCAIGLVGCSSSEDGAVSSPTSAGYALAAAGDLALSAARAAGMQVAPLPAYGCSASLLDPNRVVELLYSLPEAQRTALATAMDASAGVWMAQLYKGEQGAGLCLPVQQALILLPASANATVNKLADAAAPLQGAAQ